MFLPDTYLHYMGANRAKPRRQNDAWRFAEGYEQQSARETFRPWVALRREKVRSLVYGAWILREGVCDVARWTIESPGGAKKREDA